jgi:hypothetical protein
MTKNDPTYGPMHRSSRARNLLRGTILTAAATMMLAGCHKTIDDATLTNNVKAALAADTVISQQPIQYAVQNGVVTLTGNVTDDTARQLAAQDVAKVAGVKEVVNSLEVAGIPTAPTITTAAAPTQARPTTPSERRAIEHHEPLPTSGSSANTAATEPAAPPQPVVRTVHIAAGTVIPIRINESLSSETAQTGQPFHGVVTHEVDADGMLAIPAGSSVTGTVTEAKDATHFKGSSLLSITLNSVRVRGERVQLATDAYTVAGKGRGVNTAEKVGGGAAIGAILGGIFGGGKGAAIGAAAGGGGGAAVQGFTRGQQVSIPSESVLRFHTVEPITVQTSELPYASQDNTQQGDPTLQQRP